MSQSVSEAVDRDGQSSKLPEIVRQAYTLRQDVRRFTVRVAFWPKDPQSQAVVNRELQSVENLFQL